MIDEYLIKKGYIKYEPTQFDDKELVVARFQKRFDDKNGKKYFIDVIKNSWNFVPEFKRDKWWKEFTYTYETQITIGKDENPIDMQFFSCWKLEDVEKFMEEMFEKMKINYYEEMNEKMDC